MDTPFDDVALAQRINDGTYDEAMCRALIAELRRLRADLDVERVKRASDLLEASARDAEVEALREDGARLDWLINWFGNHDDWKGSGVRDWDDDADARAAIDAARKREEG